MKAVTLVPEYHGYKLTDERGRAALARISDYGVPLLLRQRIEDGRQRHSWDRAEDLTLASVLEVAAAYPKLRFILANWAGLDGEKLAGAGLKGRCLIDFARMGVAYATASGWRAQQEIPKLMTRLGVESIGFGSHIPFAYISPALVKLANLQTMAPAAYAQIAWRNAATFLRLDV
jgi:predicted TIM-barrel fold metal-dependent hydrolase